MHRRRHGVRVKTPVSPARAVIQQPRALWIRRKTDDWEAREEYRKVRWSNCDIAGEQPDIATAEVVVSYAGGAGGPPDS
jgi:hypothetical protein